MKGLLISVVVLATLTGCATERGNVRQAQHSADQIRMIAVQREARKQEIEAESKANEKLFDSLARVCETNPDHCPAVTVALAVIGVQGVEAEGDNVPVVQLQQQRDVGLEYVKALATPVSTVLTGVAIAGIQANVQKNSSDNNRDILLGDQVADRGIVEAVAGLGAVAASQTGIEVGGDYMVVSDEGVVDQSSTTTTTSATDSYNSSDTNQTYTASDNAFVNAGIADYRDYIIDYEGSDMTLGQLISTLNAAGASYSIDLDGDGTVDVEGGDGTDPVAINCDGPQFSPTPPECNAT